MKSIKSDTALLARFCYFVAEGKTLSVTSACALFSAQEEEERAITWPSVYGWLRDPTIILPEFMSEVDITFKRAFTIARKVAAIAAVTNTLEDKVANGVKSLVWAHGGEPSWTDDEYACSLSEADFKDALAMGIVYHDKKRRDADGNRIQRSRVDPAPAQLVEMFARSQMRRIYGDKSELAIKGNVNLGVQVLGRSTGRPFSPPRAIPMVEVIEQPSVVETTPEMLAIEYNDAEKVPVESYVAAPPVSANEAALMLRATQGRTQMERDLSQRALDAMRKAREGKST